MIRKIIRDQLAAIQPAKPAAPAVAKGLVIQPMPEREKRTPGRLASPKIDVAAEIAKKRVYIPTTPVPKELCIVCHDPVYWYETLEPEPICLYCEKMKDWGII